MGELEFGGGVQIEKYQCWKDENGEPFIPVALDGLDLIHDRILSKGSAFTDRERKEFRLSGLLPPHVSTMDEQLGRVYEGFSQSPTDIAKYAYLRALQDRKEILFYALVSRHLEEMVPIIYTPTVGKACQQFSHRYKTTRGLYITQENVDDLPEMIHHFPSRDIHIIVVTDNQGILGIGDQGVGGMGIPIGKLSLYVLGAGIHPASCLPVTLDIGTDNEQLLNDPLYLGAPHPRITGADYAQFIEKFVGHVKACFPDAVLQWEDFSKENAYRNLLKYEQVLPSFNDDIQGTGAVVLGGILSAVKIKREKLTDQVFAVYGLGAGGGGIARQIQAGLIEQGMPEKDAADRIFTFDSQGLILSNREGLSDYKKCFAKDPALVSNCSVTDRSRITLSELMAHQKITVLIGTSKQTGAFSKDIVRQMCVHCNRPMIFPLSNPTSKCEAVPEDLLNWSEGQAIIATGSPFPAAHALSECVSNEDLVVGAVYPKIKDLQQVSQHVATAILKKSAAYDPESGLRNQDIPTLIQAATWKPEYLPYRRV